VWVQNLDAAHGDAVISHRGSARVRLVSVPPEQRAPILQEYVRVASSGRKHFPLPAGAPLADFEAIAGQYPVYRIEAPAAHLTAVDRTFITNHPVLTYCILTFGISWGGGLVVLGPGGILGIRQPSEAEFLFAILAGIAGPSVAGLLLTWLFDGRTGLLNLRSRLFKWRVGAGWYAAAFLTGPLIASAAIFALSLADSEYLPGILVSDHKVSLLLIGIAVGLAAGFFEELGWTGFAIPRLRRRYSILKTGVIVGVLWGAWHLPLFSGKGSPSGVPIALYLSVLLFSFLPPFRVLMVWVYDRTASLLVVVILHAGLSATSLILQPPATANVVAYDLAFAALLWVVVAVVTAFTRSAAPSRL
jgi:membrane protease YdiL (CAAX protease family)